MRKGIVLRCMWEMKSVDGLWTQSKILSLFHLESVLSATGLGTVSLSLIQKIEAQRSQITCPRIKLILLHSVSQTRKLESSWSLPLPPLSHHQTLWILTPKSFKTTPSLHLHHQFPKSKNVISCLCHCNRLLTVSLTPLQSKLHTTARRIKKTK